jgi:hypothetical protein
MSRINDGLKFHITTKISHDKCLFVFPDPASARNVKYTLAVCTFIVIIVE